MLQSRSVVEVPYTFTSGYAKIFFDAKKMTVLPCIRIHFAIYNLSFENFVVSKEL